MEASGSHPIFAGCTHSSPDLAGSAYQAQWVSNFDVYTGHVPITPWVDPSPGFKNVPTVLGPITRTVQDIEIACRATFGKWANYSSVPVLYREVKLKDRLKFGYYFNDGISLITPACSRALSETIEALREQGHECVEFKLPSRELRACLSRFRVPHHVTAAEKASEAFIALLSAQGDKSFFENKGSDPTVRNIKGFCRLCSPLTSFRRIQT